MVKSPKMLAFSLCLAKSRKPSRFFAILRHMIWRGWRLKARRYKRRAARWLGHNQWLVRRALYVFGALAILSVAVQLLYPAGKVLPFVEVQGKGVGGMSTNQAAKELDKTYADAKVVIKTDNKTFTSTYKEAGIDLDGAKTARLAAHYAVWERLVPFSSLAIMAGRDTKAQIRFDDDRFKYFTEQIQKNGYVPAVNAAVAVKDGEVKLVPSKPSKVYPASTVGEAVRKAAFTPRTIVELTPQIKPAQRTDDEVKGVLNQAQRAVDTALTLKLDDEKISVNKPTIGKWLDFSEDTKTKNLQLVLSADAVNKYLDGIQGKIYKTPGTTHVHLIDGREVDRTAGQTGRGIDTGKMLALLSDAVKKGDKTTITVPTTSIAPKIVYDRQYSNTDSGLAALIRDIAAAKGGYGIAVMEIGGRSATANGSKQFEAASTYKLPVAYAVFQRINSGQMSWSDTIYGSKNAEKCFDDMIVVSDNNCAKAFAAKIGWQNVEDMAHGIGMTSTDLTGSTLLTTANDLALYLYKLQNGTLLNSSDTARLIDAMKRNIYRQGIPKGTGLTVADKVGFVDNVIHDAGIVYSSHGPYVLVIMTANSSWSGIADAARQINAYL